MCALAGLSGKYWYLNWDQNDKKQLSEDLVEISKSKYIKYKGYNNVLDHWSFSETERRPADLLLRELSSS